MKSQVYRKANCVVTDFYGFLKISDIYILEDKRSDEVMIY